MLLYGCTVASHFVKLFLRKAMLLILCTFGLFFYLTASKFVSLVRRLEHQAFDIKKENKQTKAGKLYTNPRTASLKKAKEMLFMDEF